MICLAILGMATTVTVTAQDLGALGKTYKIEEQDLLEFIKQRLLKFQKEGKIKAMQQAMRQRVVQQINYPEPVQGVNAATHAKTYYFDPTITVSQDIRDHQGRLIQAKGTKVNPLDIVSMNKILVFVQGSNGQQMTWAMNYKKKAKLSVKIVLVNGPVIKLMKKHKIRIYYDQKGKLTQRFGISGVPALVYQEGKRIRIDEVVVNGAINSPPPALSRRQE